MKQLGFVEPGRAEWDEVRTPPLSGPTAALVRPTAVSMKERFPITVSSGADANALNSARRSTDAGGTCTDTGIFFEPATPTLLLATYDRGVTFTTGRAQIRLALPTDSTRS